MAKDTKRHGRVCKTRPAGGVIIHGNGLSYFTPFTCYSEPSSMDQKTGHMPHPFCGIWPVFFSIPLKSISLST